MHQRSERVARQLLRDISEILRDRITGPRFGFVTVLHTDVSKDLRNAKVYYSVMGSEDQKKATDLAIHRSVKRIKRSVNERLKLRYAMDVELLRENVLDQSFRIDAILDEIRKEPKR